MRGANVTGTAVALWLGAISLGLYQRLGYLASPMPLQAHLVAQPEALAPHHAAWDALAVAARRPYCSPDWMLAWWRHAAPSAGKLRVVVVLDDRCLVGIAPFWITSGRGRLTRFRLLGAGVGFPIEPLADRGRDTEVADAVARCLAASRPAPQRIILDGVATDSPWPALLGEAWPNGAPRARRDSALPIPTVSLRDVESFDGWLETRSRNFRQEMRRTRRRLLAAGGTIRLATTVDELDRALEAFARLHYANWEGRGGSGALDPTIEAMLRDAGKRLLPTGRFRVWTIELDGTVIEARVVLAAGGDVALWLSGYDERLSKLSPSIQTTLTAVEDAIERNERRLLMGPGGQQWKYRFADGEDRVASVTLLPRGPFTAGRAQLAADKLRRVSAERLPPQLKQRIKTVGRRIRLRGQAPRSP